jgi:hypothetical protein
MSFRASPTSSVRECRECRFASPRPRTSRIVVCRTACGRHLEHSSAVGCLARRFRYRRRRRIRGRRDDPARFGCEVADPCPVCFPTHAEALRKRCAGGRVPDGSRAMAAGITLSSRRSWPTWLMGATPPSQVRACAGAVRRAAGSGTPNSARDINPSCSYPRKGHFGAA